MQPRSLKYIAEACAGELRTDSPERMISRICTDSRKVADGDLFVALRGDRFDAHDFVRDVLERGAGAVMIERGRADGLCRREARCIIVDDTRRALGRLAERYRGDFVIPRIAIGGSNGKTTTKELVASVLNEKRVTLRSEASFNNDIGVPLTLLNLEERHQAAVLEVGTNHPGELAPLVQMIAPQYGVITSIGREHLEFFGDLAGVIEEEGWLAEMLPANGKLFLNGDVPEMEPIARRTKAKVVRVGLNESNDWRARVTGLSAGGVEFWVDAPDSQYSGEYQVRLLGRHQVANGLLAMAVGRELGLTPAELRSGLAKCLAPKMRLQLWEKNGVQILDDSYNANADSMKAALLTLRDLPCRGRRAAVLGDMAELGAHGEFAHREVGQEAAAAGVDVLFAVGSMAPIMAQAARDSGLPNVTECRTVEEAAQAVRDWVQPGDLILLKASRAARLEQIAEMIRKS